MLWWSILVGVCVGDPLNFMVIGDWGCDCQIQYEVASGLGNVSGIHQSHFTLALGDNFYSSGIHGNAHSPRFKKTFEDVYTSPNLQSRWYVVAGNHDHLGNVSAEIAYTQLSKRWYFPDYWYDETFTLPNSNVTVQLIFIDTVVLSGQWSDREPQPLGAADPALADKQWDWLHTTLNSSTADWIFVGGHYPVWSTAEHGPTKTLVEKLLPLLEEYHVAAYWNGHDHNMQHLEDNQVDYWVTGNGGANEVSHAHASAVPKNSLKFYHGNGGLMGVSVINRTHYQGAFYGIKGRVLYSVVHPNPRHPPAQ